MLNIEAILSVTPTSYKCQIPDNLIITRGATAALTLDLSTKPYTFENIDQITFILKQGQAIYWFKMFTYLQPTQDTVITPGKNYYADVKQIDSSSLQCEAILVEDPTGSPIANNYFEEANDSSNWQTTKYILDPHFSYRSIEDLNCITMVLSAEDTLNFSANANKNIEYEIAIKLDTKAFPGYCGQDSIIIEPQPSIVVLDSLYSKVQERGQSNDCTK